MYCFRGDGGEGRQAVMMSSAKKAVCTKYKQRQELTIKVLE